MTDQRIDLQLSRLIVMIARSSTVAVLDSS